MWTIWYLLLFLDFSPKRCEVASSRSHPTQRPLTGTEGACSCPPHLPLLASEMTSPWLCWLLAGLSANPFKFAGDRGLFRLKLPPPLQSIPDISPGAPIKDYIVPSIEVHTATHPRGPLMSNCCVQTPPSQSHVPTWLVYPHRSLFV